MSLIQVKTNKLTTSFPCRAFYDNAGGELSVGIKQKGSFHSYVEAKFFSFDLTRDGRLLNIDVWKPKEEWTIQKDIAPPEEFDKQDVIFLEHRLKIDPVSYFTNEEGTLLYIRFAKQKINRFVSPANSLIFELDNKDSLIGLWITDIEEDHSFRKEAKWRVSVKSPDND